MVQEKKDVVGTNEPSEESLGSSINYSSKGETSLDDSIILPLGYKRSACRNNPHFLHTNLLSAPQFPIPTHVFHTKSTPTPHSLSISLVPSCKVLHDPEVKQSLSPYAGKIQKMLMLFPKQGNVDM